MQQSCLDSLSLLLKTACLILFQDHLPHQHSACCHVVYDSSYKSSSKQTAKSSNGFYYQEYHSNCFMSISYFSFLLRLFIMSLLLITSLVHFNNHDGHTIINTLPLSIIHSFILHLVSFYMLFVSGYHINYLFVFLSGKVHPVTMQVIV